MFTGLPTLDAAHAMLADFASAPALFDGSPAFLFRGERCDYEETLSTLDRHCRQLGLMSAAYKDLDNVAQYAQEARCTDWDLHPRLGAAFCQHYGLPTPMFDFTSDPTVALRFASNRAHHQPMAKTGWVGVLDVAKARADGCAIFDLRNFGPAKRPGAQSAFGFMRAYSEKTIFST